MCPFLQNPDKIYILILLIWSADLSIYIYISYVCIYLFHVLLFLIIHNVIKRINYYITWRYLHLLYSLIHVAMHMYLSLLFYFWWFIIYFNFFLRRGINQINTVTCYIVFRQIHGFYAHWRKNNMLKDYRLCKEWM